eukprot:scaffold7844_cov137-Skeletonema_marinoi.AAC.2
MNDGIANATMIVIFLSRKSSKAQKELSLDFSRRVILMWRGARRSRILTFRKGYPSFICRSVQTGTNLFNDSFSLHADHV